MGLDIRNQKRLVDKADATEANKQTNKFKKKVIYFSSKQYTLSIATQV